MKCLALSLGLFLLMGCGAIVNVAPFDETERQPTQSVDIFSDRSSVDRPYKEIGLITADDNGWDKSEADLIAILRNKAMEIGADAIILSPGEQSKQGSMLIGDLLVDSNKRIVKAVAIVYTDKSP